MRLVLHPNILWSILEDVLCAYGKNVYLLSSLGLVFYTCVLHLVGLQCYEILCSLLFFCLDILSIIENWLLKSPVIIWELCIFPSVLFVLLPIFEGSFYVYNCCMFLMNWLSYQYVMSISFFSGLSILFYSFYFFLIFNFIMVWLADKNCIYLKCAIRFFDIHIKYEMIITWS